MKKVYIDVGHGGTDSGAVGNGLLEKNVNLGVALELGKILKDYGIAIKYSRTTDKTVGLSTRCVDANNWKADIFVSIHHNAYKSVNQYMGYEVIHSIYGGNGLKLAKLINAEFLATGMKCHRGCFSRKSERTGKDYYSVIRQTSMPAIITEYGYIDSKDVGFFNNREKRKKEAIAIAKGILKYFGIAYKEPKEQQTLYIVSIGAYSQRANAEKMIELAKQKGLKPYLKIEKK